MEEGTFAAAAAAAVFGAAAVGAAPLLYHPVKEKRNEANIRKRAKFRPGDASAIYLKGRFFISQKTPSCQLR